MCIEIKVKVSNEERALTQDFLLYETISASQDDPKLKEFVEKVVKDFHDDVDDVRVTIKMEW